MFESYSQPHRQDCLFFFFRPSKQYFVSMTKMPDCFDCLRIKVCTSCSALLITNCSRWEKKLVCVCLCVCACKRDGCVPLPSPLLWGCNYAAWMATCYSLCFFHACVCLLDDEIRKNHTLVRVLYSRAIKQVIDIIIYCLKSHYWRAGIKCLHCYWQEFSLLEATVKGNLVH